MPNILKGILIFLSCSILGCATCYLLGMAFGLGAGFHALAALGLVGGALYGLEAAALLTYRLQSTEGWIQLLLDLTWSLPNTLFGLVFGNLIYIFFGSVSRSSSEDQGWIVFLPRGSGAFGNQVLQTLGTINLGGAGSHERVHLLQARIFGPLYLPVFAVNYVVNFLLQCLWCASLGWILKLAGVRNTVNLEPPTSSVVKGFFGWIYAATLFELWAYG